MKSNSKQGGLIMYGFVNNCTGFLLSKCKKEALQGFNQGSEIL